MGFFSSRFSVLGSRFSVLGSQFSVLGSRFAVFGLVGDAVFCPVAEGGGVDVVAIGPCEGTMIEEDLGEVVGIAEWGTEGAMAIGGPGGEVEFGGEVVAKPQADEEGAGEAEGLHLAMGDVGGGAGGGGTH
jgi:hypothetical protein